MGVWGGKLSIAAAPSAACISLTSVRSFVLGPLVLFPAPLSLAHFFGTLENSSWQLAEGRRRGSRRRIKIG